MQHRRHVLGNLKWVVRKDNAHFLFSPYFAIFKTVWRAKKKIHLRFSLITQDFIIRRSAAQRDRINLPVEINMKKL